MTIIEQLDAAIERREEAREKLGADILRLQQARMVLKGAAPIEGGEVAAPASDVPLWRQALAIAREMGEFPLLDFVRRLKAAGISTTSSQAYAKGHYLTKKGYLKRVAEGRYQVTKKR